uniref:Ribosome-binding factor A, mitochondrial n=1 Tax=Strigamia maritima TaxID=126957 RepID=T1IMV0_STRMM
MNAVCIFRCRFFSTGSYLLSGKTSRQQFTMLEKLLNRGSKKAEKRLSNNTNYLTQPVVAKAGKCYPMQESKRQIVLNKLLLEHLCDLMATEEMSKLLSGYGLEILQVQTTKNFSVVKVFWFCSEKSNENEIQRILDANASKIRSELIKLHILGNVPQIQFFCDQTQAVKNRVFGLLDKIKSELDIETDDVPIEWRTIPVIKTDADLKSIVGETRDISSDELGDMTHDIYGLDRDTLMNKVSERCGKRRESEDEVAKIVPVSKTVSIDPEINKQFAKFLQDRKRRKGNKRDQMLCRHLIEPSFDSYSNCDINSEFDDEDFYEDEDYNK